jgi:hypothetical protein
MRPPVVERRDGPGRPSLIRLRPQSRITPWDTGQPEANPRLSGGSLPFRSAR